MLQKHISELILVFAAILFFEGISFSQQADYKSIFGDDWAKAELFINENEAWMKKLSERYNVSYPVAVSVVFPELIRYSALRDKMETQVLKILFINLGEEYANFSIGNFQMKPSFAELVRKMIPLLKSGKRTWFPDITDYDNLKEFRTRIVEDLETVEIQFIYLLAFVKICETIYDIDNLDINTRIKFLATAYNFSFQKSFHEVQKMADKKFFNTGLLKGEKYSYSDISVYWYTTYSDNQLSGRSGDPN